jgi:Polyketide cyclase / dehydrase and lipid transport
VLTIDRSARASVAASPQRCLELLSDVEAYPSWASLIRQVEVVGERVRVRAELLGVPFVMDCELELGPDRAVLRRLPYDEEDDERYEAAWTVRPAGSGAEVELHVTAALDAPGPARLLRGRVERRLVDDLLADFARAVKAPRCWRVPTASRP